MKTKNYITYYCFNKACNGSVYFSDTIRVNELPITITNLAENHYCDLCHSRMISIIDIEIKLAVSQGELQPYKLLHY